jgi:hypothetical protein
MNKSQSATDHYEMAPIPATTRAGRFTEHAERLCCSAMSDGRCGGKEVRGRGEFLGESVCMISVFSSSPHLLISLPPYLLYFPNAQ